ncbi:lipid-A-disaccharide kinase [Spirosomataceae bacterium TFI 002]|nr:lipid-A-disaccharide kinase [Spirosomataceae bacterium TFI 002]
MRILRFVLLYPFAVIYDLITSLRNKLFDKGFLKSHKPQQFTVSIGNLSVGGSGKTPFIKYLIKNFGEKQIGVLSRGYGRKTKGFFEVTSESLASQVGDEPKMIKDSTRADVFVCEDRVLGAKKIYDINPRIEILLLDDAFQHRYIKPNLSVLITPFDNPFTSDYLLPAGLLRESRKGANRADVIIVSKVPLSCSEDQLRDFELHLFSKLTTRKPLFFCHYLNSTPVNVENKELLSGDKVLLVSGLADNNAFQKYAKSHFEVSDIFAFNDHYNYSESDVFRFFKNSLETKILTTAKDYIKLKDICSQEQLVRVFHTETEVVFVDQKEKFKAIVLNAFEAHS